MSATAEAPERIRLTREQAAERLREVLTEEPQTLVSLRQQVLGSGSTASKGNDAVRNGLNVLEALGEAKQIPRRGWVLESSAHDAAIASPENIEWPFEHGLRVRLDECFVDKNYQRPLTSFVNKIVKGFDPRLWQVLAVNDRGSKAPKGKRYSLIDGQTRWAAGTRLGIVEAPAIIYDNISPEEEAELFALLQKERKGMISWHRFRAEIAAKNETALAILAMAISAGYTLGDGEGELRAIAALEKTFNSDQYLLGRTLSDLHEAWPDQVPEAPHISGLHYFFRHYPLDKQNKQGVDDTRLVKRLKAAGLDGLKRKAIAAKELSSTKRSNSVYMAQAIQQAYLGR